MGAMCGPAESHMGGIWGLDENPARAIWESYEREPYGCPMGALLEPYESPMGALCGALCGPDESPTGAR
jgi:hypothetical protein